MKKLNEIVDCEYDIDIIGVADDSRNVSEGYLFVATKGYYVDHFDYIEDAINNGAVAVIVDRNVKLKIPTIVVEDINDYYFEVCKRFYDVSPSDFSFIGITGTDGKTTTATVVSQLLNKVELCAYIGTNGVQINDSYYPTTNTTPCVGELFKCLKFIKERNCKLVVMEVSSEALLHERLKGFNYDMVAYTNITLLITYSLSLLIPKVCKLQLSIIRQLLSSPFIITIPVGFNKDNNLNLHSL